MVAVGALAGRARTGLFAGDAAHGGDWVWIGLVLGGVSQKRCLWVLVVDSYSIRKISFGWHIARKHENIYALRGVKESQSE